jgi:hypothetical protein
MVRNIDFRVCRHGNNNTELPDPKAIGRDVTLDKSGRIF